MTWLRRRLRAPVAVTVHLDHSSVPRADWDELFRRYGHLRYREQAGRLELEWWRAYGRSHDVTYRPLHQAGDNE